ncbi:hypothetical protein STEG23_012513, partial [Scotinomys teguina]
MGLSPLYTDIHSLSVALHARILVGANHRLTRRLKPPYKQLPGWVWGPLLQLSLQPRGSPIKRDTRRILVWWSLFLAGRGSHSPQLVPKPGTLRGAEEDSELDTRRGTFPSSTTLGMKKVSSGHSLRFRWSSSYEPNYLDKSVMILIMTGYLEVENKVSLALELLNEEEMVGFCTCVLPDAAVENRVYIAMIKPNDPKLLVGGKGLFHLTFDIPLSRRVRAEVQLRDMEGGANAEAR